MHTTIKHYLLAGTFALVSGLASAQGAPLLLPAKAQTPETAARLDALSRQPGIAKVTPMTIDANALNSNVISVTIGKKTYVFAGHREKTSAEHENWFSDDKTSGNGMVLSRNVASGDVSGSIYIAGVHYSVEPGLLIQNTPPNRPATVADLTPKATLVDPSAKKVHPK